MAPSAPIFLQVALLCCVVTTSMGGITDLQEAFSKLEKRMKVSQDKIELQQKEIKSLYQIIEKLEKRLEQLEEKSEFGEVQIQQTVPM